LLRKLTVAAVVMAMFGVSKRLSLIVVGSLTKASLGALSGDVVEVTHKIPSGLTALAATQPAGNAGAVTPSKFSLRVPHGVGVGVPGVGVGGGVGVGVHAGHGVGVAQLPVTCSVSTPM
jgi:hypothetical protein